MKLEQIHQFFKFTISNHTTGNEAFFIQAHNVLKALEEKALEEKKKLEPKAE